MATSGGSLTQADVTVIRSFMTQLPSLIGALSGNSVPATQHAAPARAQAPVASVPTTVSTTGQAPAPILPYQSMAVRNLSQTTSQLSQGHPNSGRSVSTPMNFEGLRSLGGNVTRQIVNQQRRASAAATIPMQPGLQPRTSRRGRGTAIAPPGILQAPTMQQAALLSEVDGSVQLRIRVKVYPPTESANQELYLYQNFVDSLNSILENHFLLHDYIVSANTTVAQLINMVADSMRTSPLDYQFSARFSRGIIQHEALPLRLLGLMNRGRPRPSDRQIHLQRMALAASTPLSALFTNSSFYANPRLCLEGQHFVLHFIGSHYPFVVKLPSSSSNGGEDLLKWHRCLSRRIYRLLPYDGYIDSGDEDGSEAGCGSECEGEDVDMDPSGTGSSANQSQPVNMALIRSVPSISGHNGQNSTTALPSSGPGSERPRYDLPQVPMQPFIWTLPSRIWTSPWTRPRLPDQIEDLLSIDDVKDYVSENASLGAPRYKFSIRGKNISELADKFREAIISAVTVRDFSNILSPDREFVVEMEDGSIRSLGVGIESEVLFTAFSQLQAHGGQWFLPRVDETASIATMHSFSTAGSISRARKEGMEVFGALTALLLAQGVPPVPLSPLVLHFIIHACDVHSLHSNLVSEWHPELASTIQRWIETGPTGPVSSFQQHFATWHDVQVGVFHERDEASHHALAAEMLFKAIIGTEPPTHPEIQAFISGFRLPCRNGFDFMRVLKLFEGGAELYLGIIWTSLIKGFSDLEPHIRYRPPIPSVISQAFGGFSEPNVSLPLMLAEFLKGTGVPCPGLFEEAKNHFSDLALQSLDNVDSAAFRSKMFCWAATGYPSVGADFGDLTVSLVGDNDSSYGVAGIRESMICEGKISFRTCARQIRIPASYIARLSDDQYSGEKEPRCLKDALHHWLLCEILNAIGGHTIL